VDRGLPPVGARSMTTADSVRDDEPVVRLTEREALANVAPV
jgi:hypothetical protein